MSTIDEVMIEIPQHFATVQITIPRLKTHISNSDTLNQRCCLSMLRGFFTYDLTFAFKTETLGSLYSHALLILLKSI